MNTSLVCAVGLRNEFRLAFTRERACLERSSSRRSCLGKGRMRTATLSVCFSIYFPVFAFLFCPTAPLRFRRSVIVQLSLHQQRGLFPTTDSYRAQRKREHLSSIDHYWQFLLLRICICFKCVLFFYSFLVHAYSFPRLLHQPTSLG